MEKKQVIDFFFFFFAKSTQKPAEAFTRQHLHGQLAKESP